MEEKSIPEKLDNILQKLENTEGKKKFKLPFLIRWFGRFKLKKDFVIVQIIKTNGQVSFKMLKIEDGTVKIGETIHDACASNVLRYKKYPLIIVPIWNMKPFSPRENLEEAEKEGTLTAAQKLILTKMKMEVVKPKMNWNMKTVLVILAVLAAGYFLLDYLKVM